MRLLRIKIICCFFFRLAAEAWAAPAFVGVTANNTTIERLDKYELSFTLSGTTYSNPFDPAQMDVSATFTAPSGLTHTVHGFLMRNYTRTGCPTESLTAGSWQWKVRYAPMEVGAYSVALKAIDSVSGTGNAGPYGFTSIASGRRGFFKVSPLDSRYFCYEDGSQFIPVGQNVAWNTLPGGYSCDYDLWLNKMAAQGGNFQRYWFAEFADGFEWSDTGLGNYTNRIANTWRTDYTVELARSLGIQMQLTIMNMGELRASGFENKWPGNPYNSANGGPCASPAQFFTDATARSYYKRKLRYMVARWGYASNISWETFNEMDFVDGYNSANIKAWHQDVIPYLKSLDLNRHLVSTSFSDPSSDDANIWSLPEIDFTGFHRYTATVAMEDEHVAYTQSLASFNKPVLGGETGIVGGNNSLDPNGVYFHNSLWAGISCGAAGTPLIWFWNDYIEPNNFYPHYKGVSRFAATVDYPGSNFAFVRPSVSTAAYADVAIQPGYSGWGSLSGASSFSVDPTGAISPDASQLHQYLPDPSKTGWYAPVTFTASYGVAGTFKVTVSNSSGSNNLRIRLDGSTVFSSTVSNGNTYSVAVGAGSHVITVDVTSGDWIQVSAYTFGGYCPALKVLSLVGPSSIAGWGVNRDYNYDYVRLNGTPAAITGAVIHFTGVTNGNWNLDWWDTYNGVISSSSVVTASGGLLDLNVPNTSKDIAFRLNLAAAGPSNTPSATPSASQTPFATGTATPSPSASPSASSSPTPSLTRSASPTGTAGPSATPTASPSISATWTASPTETPYAGSPTDSPSASPTPSGSPTQTASATFSPSFTLSSTPSSSASPTPNLAASATSTVTATAGSSATASPTPSSGSGAPGEIDQLSPSLNPQPGPGLLLSAHLTGASDEIEIRIYSAALTLSHQSKISGAYVSGWNLIWMPDLKLANGAYFVRAKAKGQSKAKACHVMLIN